MQKLQQQVSLFGKHPSSCEYLHFGQDSNFANSIVQWIQKGYESLLQSRTVNKLDKIYHFYFLNTQNDSFICGTVKLSRDAIKREYPLVIFTEINPYSSFLTPYQTLQYSEIIWKDILKIFEKDCDLNQLKTLLAQLETSKQNELNYKVSQDKMVTIKEKIEDKSITIVNNNLKINWQNIDQQIQSFASSIFVSEQFCKIKLLYRPLQIDDFITIMR